MNPHPDPAASDDSPPLDAAFIAGMKRSRRSRTRYIDLDPRDYENETRIPLSDLLDEYGLAR
jgi:hypothetical protein